MRRLDVEGAAEAIRGGGLVAIPTETVYGLAAAATDVEAVGRIFDVKGRPRGHPLIVHLADPEDLTTWAPQASPSARALAAAAWPGPLTLVVPRGALLPADVAGGLATVGIRVPAHGLARRVVELAGTPLAAPSANRFGSVSPTTVDHVIDDLGHLLDPERDGVLDGGPCPVGVESTIVDTTADPVQILRSGAVTEADVATILGVGTAPVTGPARASGMLASHYAPRCQIRLVDARDDADALAAGTPGARVLDLSDDVARYARDLYSELRGADRDGVRVLITVLPSAEGLGHAVRDRLTRAAAPRPAG